MTTLQERQRDLFETIKSLEKDIQVCDESTTSSALRQRNSRTQQLILSSYDHRLTKQRSALTEKKILR